MEKHDDIYRFVKGLIAARLRWDTSDPNREVSLSQILRQARIQWHGVKLSQPDWSPDSHSLALTAWSRRGRLLTHIMLNAYWEPLAFELPPVLNLQGKAWHRWIDTALDPPEDIGTWANAPAVPGESYLVQSRSIVVLMERIAKETAGNNPEAKSETRNPKSETNSNGQISKIQNEAALFKGKPLGVENLGSSGIPGGDPNI